MKAAPEWFDLPMRALEYLLIRVLPIAAPFLPLVFLGPVPVSVRDLPLIAVGYVRDSITLEPIQGARVFADADPIRFETRTDERGRFELKLPALGSGREPPDAFENGYSVLAEANGYRSAQVSKVEDPEGRPIPYPFAIGCPGGTPFGRGDSEGRLLFPDAMYGTLGGMTVVSAPGRESLLRPAPGTVRLGPDAPITGRVTGADGNAAARVEIFAGDSVDLATATVPPRYRSLPAVTDTLGRFTLRGVPEGRQVFVYRPIPNGNDPEQLGETTGGAADIEIRLPD